MFTTMLCCCSSTGVLIQPSASSGAIVKCFFLQNVFVLLVGSGKMVSYQPYLFKLYVRDLLKVVVGSNIGCNTAGCLVNILAYADDMVLLAPSWRGLQCLLDLIGKAATNTDMSFNINKTMIYLSALDVCSRRSAIQIHV